MIGHSVADQGAAILLTRKTNPQQIHPAALEVLDSGDFRQAAARLGAQLRARNAAAAGADHLLALLNSAPQESA